MSDGTGGWTPPLCSLIRKSLTLDCSAPFLLLLWLLSLSCSQTPILGTVCICLGALAQELLSQELLSQELLPVDMGSVDLEHLLGCSCCAAGRLGLLCKASAGSSAAAPPS